MRLARISTIVLFAMALMALAISNATAEQRIPVARWAKDERLPIPPEPFPTPQPADQLTVQEAENLALKYNPTLAQAQAAVEAAQAAWLQAGLPPNPHIGYSGQQLGSGGLAEQQGLLISQDIVRGGKLRLNREVASHQIEVAHQEFIQQRFRVLTDTRTGFYDVLSAQRRLERAEELVNINNQALKVAEDLLRAQEVSRVDVVQAQVETESARILAQRARNQHLAAWRSLTAVLGVPNMPITTLAGRLEDAVPETTWDEALERLLTRSPEISAALASVEQARWAVQRARVEAVPDISVQAVIQHDNGTQSANGNLQVTLPIPVVNRNQGGILRAESQLIAADRNVQRVELSLQRRLAPVFERYASARNQVNVYSEKILPIAQESLELIRAGYQAGEFGFLNLLTAQRTYSQTNLAYIESLRELWLASLEIDGLLLSDSLQSGSSAPQSQEGLISNR
jgi:cobalt-zinc-cadmium efflux system outer membrane protein